MPRLMTVILALVGPGLAACGDAAIEPTDLVVDSDGQAFGYRHVPDEPATYLAGTGVDPLPVQPALRIAGPTDVLVANRAMARICGLDPDAAESYGAFGDPVIFDESAGEWVYWLDCTAGRLQ